MKKVVYVDMDNVLVDFQSGIDQLNDEILKKYDGRLDEVPGIFGLMQPMQNAIASYIELTKHFDVYILSTSPWENETALIDKLRWVKKYLGEVAYKRLILSHHKNLNKGDYLIDDRTKNGTDRFEGEHIHFGTKKFMIWDDVINYLIKQLSTKKMNLKETHTYIGNNWIKIIGISDELKKVLSDFDGDNLIGYVYFDHTHGVTLDIIKLFDIQGKEIIYRESPSDKNIRIISRLDGIIRSKEIHLLPEELIEELNLKIPEYLSAYERPDLIKFRLDNNFHEFRADGFPDDVQILLLPNNNYQPELIWGRVEKYENGYLTCNLLNRPHQDFGLKINETIDVSIQNIKDDKYLVYKVETIPNAEMPINQKTNTAIELGYMENKEEELDKMELKKKPISNSQAIKFMQKHCKNLGIPLSTTGKSGTASIHFINKPKKS